MKLLLASGSPRRRELLLWCGYTFEVSPSHCDESRDPAQAPIAHARTLALRKLHATSTDCIALAADTVVHSGDRIFDKPEDRVQARAHLAALSGAWHAVTTAVAITGQPVFSVTTQVRFRELLATEIDAYLATGEADDKAGAYGIQGRARAFVAEVQGSWTNVVGLPLEPTIAALDRAGIRR